jgi:hypothetical protein
VTEHLPAQRLQAPLARPAPPGLIRDISADFGQAQTTTRQLSARGSGHDMTVGLATVVHCTGDTTADALQAAADFFDEAPLAQLQSIAWSRSPGHRDGAWEYTATLTVSFPDERGEYSGLMHHTPDR